MQPPSLNLRHDANNHAQIDWLVSQINEKFNHLKSATSEAIAVIGYNLDYEDYLVFKSNTPSVIVFLGGNHTFHWATEPINDAETIGRCIQFVVNAALSLEARQ